MIGVIKMAVLTVKKYKYIKDESGNKIKVEKTKEEWDRETKKSTAIYYFSERYEVNGKRKQYKSSLYEKKRDAEAREFNTFKNKNLFKLWSNGYFFVNFYILILRTLSYV